MRQASVPEESECIDKMSPSPYRNSNFQRMMSKQTKQGDGTHPHKKRSSPVLGTKQPCRISIGSNKTATTHWNWKQI